MKEHPPMPLGCLGCVPPCLLSPSIQTVPANENTNAPVLAPNLPSVNLATLLPLKCAYRLAAELVFASYTIRASRAA